MSTYKFKVCNSGNVPIGLCDNSHTASSRTVLTGAKYHFYTLSVTAATCQLHGIL